MRLAEPADLSLRFLISLMVIVVAPLPAFAGEEGDEPELSDEQREAAKQHFLEGSSLFSRGEYETAAREFRAAFEIVRSPEILFNIGRCHEELKETYEAIYHYEMYLRFYPTAEDAEDVRRRIDAIKGGEAREAGGQPDEGEEAETSDDSETGGDTDSGGAPGAEPWRGGFRLGANVGFGYNATGPADGIVFPTVEVNAFYPVWEWLMIGASLDYGRVTFLSTGVYSVERQLGFLLGARGRWPLTEQLAILGRFGVSPLWVKFTHDKTLTWLAFRGDVGIDYRLGENWALIAAAVIAFGPYVGGDEVVNTKLDEPDPQTQISATIGVEYVF